MHRFNRKQAISLGHIGVKHQCIGSNDHLLVKWSVLWLTFVFTHSQTYAPLYFRSKYSNVLHILIHIFSFYLWTAVVLFDQCEQKKSIAHELGLKLILWGTVALCCFKAIVLNYIWKDLLICEGQIKLIEDINSVLCLLLLLCQ